MKQAIAVSVVAVLCLISCSIGQEAEAEKKLKFPWAGQEMNQLFSTTQLEATCLVHNAKTRTAETPIMVVSGKPQWIIKRLVRTPQPDHLLVELEAHPQFRTSKQMTLLQAETHLPSRVTDHINIKGADGWPVLLKIRIGDETVEIKQNMD
ncbi:MAG: hypothetical protein ACLFUJ_11705 [Phycisphaerae bacterium]